MKRFPYPLVLASLLSLLATGSALAQDQDHAPLQRSDSLSFDTLLEQALQQSPQYREIAAREAEAQSHQAVGNSWIAGRPSVQVDYLDDRSLSNLGQTELTWGVSLPLWRPGEKQAMKSLGQQYSTQSSAWQQAFRLQTAGALRSALADLQEADAMLQQARQATVDAQDLLRITEALFAAGELAQQDVVQARALLLAQQRQTLDAEAARVDAERNYTVLTGLQIAPATPHRETQTPSEEIAATHPALQLLQSDIDLQDSNILKAENTAKGSPSLTLGSRRQKDGPGAGYSNALALSVNIPLGGKTFVSAAASNARRAKVEAEVAYYTVLRDLGSQLHEVEHSLFTLGESLPLMEEQASLARQQWEMARTAFEVGETDMSRVIIALQLSRDTAKEYEALTLRQQRLITEYNQIIGVLP